MKRPEYIEITFPRSKSTIRPAVKRYFKRLENKVLKINFGEYRVKKVFEYEVSEINFKEWIFSWPHKEYPCIKIKARLKEEPRKENSSGE